MGFILLPTPCGPRTWLLVHQTYGLELVVHAEHQHWRLEGSHWFIPVPFTPRVSVSVDASADAWNGYHTHTQVSKQSVNDDTGPNPVENSSTLDIYMGNNLIIFKKHYSYLQTWIILWALLLPAGCSNSRYQGVVPCMIWGKWTPLMRCRPRINHLPVMVGSATHEFLYPGAWWDSSTSCGCPTAESNTHNEIWSSSNYLLLHFKSILHNNIFFFKSEKAMSSC